MFVKGPGRAGFHLRNSALASGWGRYVSGYPHPAPVWGPPPLMPWTGPRLLPSIFNGNPSGVWVGRGLERGQGQGLPKKTPRPRPLSGAGYGKGPRVRVFQGPVCPVMNSSRKGFSNSLGEDTHKARLLGAQELVGIGCVIGVIACLAVKGAKGRRRQGGYG